MDWTLQQNNNVYSKLYVSRLFRIILTAFDIFVLAWHLDSVYWIDTLHIYSTSLYLLYRSTSLAPITKTDKNLGSYEMDNFLNLLMTGRFISSSRSLKPSMSSMCTSLITRSNMSLFSRSILSTITTWFVTITGYSSKVGNNTRKGKWSYAFLWQKTDASCIFCTIKWV